ncbi:hypothetical protein LMJ38_32280 [Streptomyces sp. R1]|nr:MULTISPECIES: hypothetical protein [unclassified Streptomyces]MCC8340585.1 hypothetical protein [Streptomyces sp. R1]
MLQADLMSQYSNPDWTKTGGRTLSLQPREVQDVLDHARLQQRDEQR